MSIPSPLSTPATSPMPNQPTFASSLIPPTPGSIQTPHRLDRSNTSRPLLSSRLSTLTEQTNSAGPSSGRKPIPSRYSNCQLCALVNEAKKSFGDEPRDGRRSSRDEMRRESRDRREIEAGPSTASSSNSSSTQPGRSTSTSPLKPSHGISRPRLPIGANINGRQILYYDSDITVYPATGKERLRGDGKHLIIVINTHAESVYELGPTDVPLLSKIIDTSQALLDPQSTGAEIQVGMVGSMMKDPQSPHSHLHAHALLGPADTGLSGSTFWRRNVVFGWSNWWSIQDLRAEIREGSSNNRIKSGYDNRSTAPIEKVPNAGSRSGLPNALEPAPHDPYSDRAIPSPTTSSTPNMV